MPLLPSMNLLYVLVLLHALAAVAFFGPGLVLASLSRAALAHTGEARAALLDQGARVLRTMTLAGIAAAVLAYATFALGMSQGVRYGWPYHASATLILVLLGVQLSFIFIPDSDVGTISLDPNTSFLLTTLVTVGAVNAMNFIDGLDGLLTGVAVITAIGFFVYSYWLGRQGYGDVFNSPALLTVVLAGACIGFLPHNFNPARIFLGDSGSMLIGMVLAAAAISTSSRTDTQSFSTLGTAIPLIMPLIMPIAVLAIPLLDMLLAVVRRARKGVNPFSTPDKMHLHHRLLEIGHTQRRAVIIMYLWTALLTFIGVGSSILTTKVVVIVAIVMVVVASGLMVTPRIRRRIDGGAPHVTRPKVRADS